MDLAQRAVYCIGFSRFAQHFGICSFMWRLQQHEEAGRTGTSGSSSNIILCIFHWTWASPKSPQANIIPYSSYDHSTWLCLMHRRHRKWLPTPLVSFQILESPFLHFKHRAWYSLSQLPFDSTLTAPWQKTLSWALITEKPFLSCLCFPTCTYSIQCWKSYILFQFFSRRQRAMPYH